MTFECSTPEFHQIQTFENILCEKICIYLSIKILQLEMSMHMANQQISLIVLMVLVAIICLVQPTQIPNGVRYEPFEHVLQKRQYGCGPCCHCTCLSDRCTLPCMSGHTPSSCNTIGK